MGTANTKHLLPPDVSDAWFKSADVCLVLDDGTAILCHSDVLSMHSAVIGNMLEDVASQHGQENKMLELPLPDFSEAECVALLRYLYEQSVPTEGTAFKIEDTASLEAAVAVARFAHTYDVPHALRHIEDYLSAFMDKRFSNSRESAAAAMETYDVSVLKWAVMADVYDMQELCAHCERAMMKHWSFYQDKHDVVDQLSSRALQRIAKGLYHTLRPPMGCSYTGLYPSVFDFMAWRQSGSIWSKLGGSA